MARKAKDEPTVKTVGQELLVELRKRWKTATEADRDNREKAMVDMKFLHVPGEQWDATAKTARGAERPMYEFNKLRVTVKRIVNDIRANRPSGKVRPVEDSDKDMAETREGLIRNILNVSDFDTITDAAAEYQVGAGMGAWRVETEYADDESFSQDICIKPINNPFCLYVDPSCEDALKRDARYWFLTSRMPKDVYENTYPEADKVGFESSEFDDDDDWQDEETVRICEYWRKTPVKKTLFQLSNGEIVDSAKVTTEQLAAAGLSVAKTRIVDSHKIEMCIVGGGDSILKPLADGPGPEFPFVMAFGEQMVVDGKKVWFGLTRFAKDSQRAYNYSRTNAIEAVSLAPKAKFWATAVQAEGLTGQWAEADKKNFPFQLYNADPKAPGPPIRMGGADVPVALIQEAQISSEDIKGVTGIFDNSLGQHANETSGIAIRARQAQGEIATFNYKDNMSKSVLRTWEIVNSLIPIVIDTERAVRVLGADGGDKYIRVNQQVPDGLGGTKTLNDLSAGKFDITMTVGPSFSTQRQEASETYTQLMQSFPQIGGIAGDLIFKAMDLPYANEIAERMQTLLPPQIQQTLGDGKAQQSPEVMQAMAQVDQAMQQVQQHAQLVQQAEQELQQVSKDAQAEKAAADQAIANAKLAQANLAVKDANLAEAVAKAQLQLVQQEQALGDRFGTDKANGDREELIGTLQQALQAIQQQSADAVQQLIDVSAQIQQIQPAPVVLEKSGPKVIRVDRLPGGGMVGTVSDSQGNELKRVEVASISNGSLSGVVTEASTDATVQ